MLIIQQTLLLGIGMSTGNSREHHMGSVIPFHPWYKNPVHIVIGKALPYFMLYIILGVYMFAVVTRLFTLPQLGHYTTFIAFLVPLYWHVYFLPWYCRRSSTGVRTQFCCLSSCQCRCCFFPDCRGLRRICRHSGNTSLIFSVDIRDERLCAYHIVRRSAERHLE